MHGLMGIMKLISVCRCSQTYKKATTNIIMSDHLPTWNNSAPTGWIFMKFAI